MLGNIADSANSLSLRVVVGGGVRVSGIRVGWMIGRYDHDTTYHLRRLVVFSCLLWFLLIIFGDGDNDLDDDLPHFFLFFLFNYRCPNAQNTYRTYAGDSSTQPRRVRHN
jgi:hypothetical protein